MLNKITWKRPVKEIIKPILDAKKKVFLEAVSDEIAIIQARTQKGLDVDDATFAPYVPQYAKKRKANSDQVSPPNLTITGSMLSSIRRGPETETDTGISTTIEFGSKIESDKAQGNMRKRKFFALSEKQLKEITNRVNKGK